ncbi:MAG: putative aspartyl protease [Saprospiraceae bacterium]|jgi:predicted aspartyl protease
MNKKREIQRLIFNWSWIKVICLFGLLACNIQGHAQSNLVLGIDLLDRSGNAKIKFEMEQGFIVIKTWLQGVIPLRLIFDTGAENTILFDKEIAELLGISFERQIPIMGSDLDSVLIANIARNVKMRIEGCRIAKRDIIVLENNNLLLKEKLGIEVSGIVGGSFFANLVVKIDYRKKEITLKHPNQFKPPGSAYENLKLQVRSNKPYVLADVSIRDNEPTRVKLLLDTGAALAFLVHSNTDDALKLPERVMVGNLGFGLSGVLRGFRGKTQRLDLGKYQFTDIATSFQDLNIDSTTISRDIVRNGILGNTFLSRFTVIIDYNKEELYLKAKGKYNKKFDFDKSGLTLFSVGQNLDQYYVVAVLVDSPAYRADIKPGDLIYKLGRRRTINMSLQAIMYKLSRKTGKKIKMTIIRDEVYLKREFNLEEWYRVID